jgi:DNA-binding MarR family transcriptional regulator
MTDLTLIRSREFEPTARWAAWRLIDEIDPEAGDLEARMSGLTAVMVDALLAADAETLEEVGDPLRDRLARLYDQGDSARELRGWLLALLSFARWALHRLPSPDEIALRHNTQAWGFLECLRAGPTSGKEIRQRLDTGESQVSRVGRDLLARGLVLQRRAGRTAVWELSPRGKQLTRDAEQREAPAREAPAREAAEARLAGSPRRTAARATSGKRASGSDRSVKRTATSSRRAAPARLLKADTAQPRAKRATTGGASSALRADKAQPPATRHVLPRESGGWQVVTEPGSRPTQVFDTKNDALERAKEIVRNAGGGQVVPHRATGEAQKPVTVRVETGRPPT